MNNTIVLVVISDVATFLITLASCFIVVGVKWGRMESDVSNMKSDLAEIKGMFRLTLKE